MNTTPHYTLIDQISSVEYLRWTWTKLNKSNKNSSGLSSETIQQFSNNLDSNLKAISEQLRHNKYNFSPVKAVAIPKKVIKDGNEIIKYRPLRIAEIKDRIVQKAIALKLDDLLSSIFHLDNECSYAYRKGKNVEEAIAKMNEYYQQGYKYILEADIEKFFDNVDKDQLIQTVEENLPDKSINKIFELALKQEIGNTSYLDVNIVEEYFSASENGIPQGNPLSPLLANIYLSQFDKEITDKGFKMIRYADDFIIMCKNEDDAKEAYQISKGFLEDRLKLKIHPLGEAKDYNSKTRIVNPQNNQFSFLSIRFDGTRCWVKEEKYLSIVEKIKDATAIKSTDGRSKNLLEVLTSLRNIVEGWIAAFHFVDLSKHLPELDKLINRQLYLILNELEFTTHNSIVEKISFKGKSNQINALKNRIRFTLGIDSCQYIWDRMRKK